jgi:hypothetical protein
MQDVSTAVKLHQVEIRARKNCICCTQKEFDREYDRESPARPGLVDDFLVSSHVRLIASD